MAENDSTAVLGSRPPVTQTADPTSATELVNSPFFVELLSRPTNTKCFVATAPGRLNLMGGVSEPYGSWTLQTTVGQAVHVSAARRTDGEVSIREFADGAKNGHLPFTISASELRDADGSYVEGARAREKLIAKQSDSVGGALGALVELIRANDSIDFSKGVSIQVSPGDFEGCAHTRASAMTVASIIALAKVFDISPDERTVENICRRICTEWLNRKACASDLACMLSGEDGLITQRQGTPSELVGSFRLPKGITLVAMDSGVVPHQPEEKLARVHTASLMGCFLIEQIRNHEGLANHTSHGVVSQVSINDYVERFRDRLPTKIKGKEFLAKFADRFEGASRIEPDYIYKVRSRTEHHIYEHARARQFAETIARATRTGEQQALIDAGEFLYASHWSYGQRCGLGSVETDLLVNLIRKASTSGDVFGAKITGFGCGGVLAILARSGDQTMTALHEAMATYTQKTGLQPRILPNGVHGALKAGVHVM